MARTLIASDNFNRASLGSDWAANLNAANAGNVSIDSSTRIAGQYSNFGTNAYSATARWVGAGTFTNDQYSSLKMLNVASAGLGSQYSIGVGVRISADTDANRDGYFGFVNGGSTTILAKVVNGTYTQIASSGTPTWADNDLISLEVEGTTLRLCKNGTPLGGVFTTTDSDLSTGAPGVFLNIALYGDDWEGGSITSGGTPVSFSGTVSAQSGTQGSSFSWTGSALSSFFSGSLTPFSYSVLSGSLPTGLSLNSSTGVVSGTPTAAGSFSAVFRATDTGTNTANTGSVAFTIASSGAATAITLTGPSTGTAGVASTNFTVGANGTITGTVTVTPSASGCTFSPSSVNISSGSPTATFTCTSAGTGAKSITLTNNGSLSNPGAWTYTVSSAGSGTITSDPLSRNNGLSPGVVTLTWVKFSDKDTGNEALLSTGISTNASGVFSVTSSSLVIGTTYRIDWKESTGEFGCAEGVAA